MRAIRQRRDRLKSGHDGRGILRRFGRTCRPQDDLGRRTGGTSNPLVRGSRISRDGPTPLLGSHVCAARNRTAERLQLLILPASEEPCGCYAPTEPLHSTRGLERCGECGTVAPSRTRGDDSERAEGRLMVAPTESRQTTNNERSRL